MLADLAPRGPRLFTRVRRTEVVAFAGIEADLFLPAGREGPPAVILVTGALLEGRQYEPMRRAATTLAAAGYAVLVPELGRLRELVLEPAAVEDLVTAAALLLADPRVRPGAIGLYGFSLGGSLALLAAARPELRDRVAFVGDVGGYFRLEAMVAVAEAGGADATTITTVRRSVEALVAAGFDMERASAALSPAAHISDIRAPVWIVHDRNDRYVPAAQSLQLADALRGRVEVHLSTTDVLSHTELAWTRRPGRVLSDSLNLLRFIRDPLARLA